MLAANEPMLAIEKVAFAATQGLHHGNAKSSVSDGQPNSALAIGLLRQRAQFKALELV